MLCFWLKNELYINDNFSYEILDYKEDKVILVGLKYNVKPCI